MRSGRLLRKTISLMLMLMMTAGLMLAVTPETYAASSGKLVKSVKEYSKSGSKWKLFRTTTYKYNKKGDPVSISISYKNGGISYKTRYTISYSYKNGKKAKAFEYVQEDGGKKSLNTRTFYDSKGRPVKQEMLDSENPDYVMSTEEYKYGKNGYITRIINVNGDTAIKYKWNGKKAKSLKADLVIDGKKYKRSLTVFNKKGFVEKPKVYTQADPVMIYTYKYKKGLVNTVNLEMQEGYDRYYEKMVISYTKKSVSQNKYRTMINAIVCGNYAESIGQFWY